MWSPGATRGSKSKLDGQQDNWILLSFFFGSLGRTIGGIRIATRTPWSQVCVRLSEVGLSGRSVSDALFVPLFLLVFLPGPQLSIVGPLVCYTTGRTTRRRSPSCRGGRSALGLASACNSYRPRNIAVDGSKAFFYTEIREPRPQVAKRPRTAPCGTICARPIYHDAGVSQDIERLRNAPSCSSLPYLFVCLCFVVSSRGFFYKQSINARGRRAPSKSLLLPLGPPLEDLPKPQQNEGFEGRLGHSPQRLLQLAIEAFVSPIRVDSGVAEKGRIR